jgi:hypothetical protein
MGITYPVGPGSILRCDYNRGGFQPPAYLAGWAIAFSVVLMTLMLIAHGVHFCWMADMARSLRVWSAQKLNEFFAYAVQKNCSVFGTSSISN